MRVLSVNVGQPAQINWRGRKSYSAIWKSPVSGPVRIRALNLDGDRQADLRVHGGPSKAVYAYPSEHYAFWRKELPEMDLPWGSFGENLTIEGILEDAIGVGDRLRVGAAELVVTQPRLPCFKLGIRFGSQRIIKRFLDSGRTGFYLGVVMEGDVEAGDAIEILERQAGAPTIAEVIRSRA